MYLLTILATTSTSAALPLAKVEMVIEQRYAFFPQQSGTVVIPAQFEFRVNTSRRFRTGIMATTQEKRRVNTEPQTITVLPAETGGAATPVNDQWLPALGRGNRERF